MIRGMDAAETREEIQGAIAHIRFHRDGFLIAALRDGTAVTGHMPSPQEGQDYRFRGRWTVHPRHGRQFAFDSYQVLYPTTLPAIARYLAEHCRGIGPRTAQRLVAAYGEAALQVLTEDPGRAAREIPGLSGRRALEAAAGLRANAAHQKLQLALTGLLDGAGVNRAVIARILRDWGEEAPDRLRRDPYALIDGIRGVGFATADRVAAHLGLDREGGPRIRAGIRHVLQEEAFSNGHTCLPRQAFLARAAALLGVGCDLVEAEIPGLLRQGFLVDRDDALSLAPLDEAERLIARRIRELLRGSPPHGQPDLEDLQEDQREALKQAVLSPVFILTGAPGTGKTFTIKRILDSFPGARVALAAPTGKAAKRITEQTGRPAGTMHRLLEPVLQDGNDFAFSRNADRPIDADLIVLDEVSMVDVPLMAAFLAAVAPGTRLILVGDTCQLPSVGPGNVLKDLIGSGRIPCTELTMIKRQDEGLIIRNCHHIKNGQDIETGDGSRDFVFLERTDEAGIRNDLLALVSTELPRSRGADPLRDIQVITPLREKTILSCEALNGMFQERLNPRPLPAGSRFKTGDKVIQTRNRYDLDLMNGDMGFVLEVATATRSITVDFGKDAGPLEMPLLENELDLAYAITCHKFQGSEARIVLIPIHRAFGPLILQRNWLYTAVSRARELCILIGDRAEIPRIIRRVQQRNRNTRLAGLLA